MMSSSADGFRQSVQDKRREIYTAYNSLNQFLLRFCWDYRSMMKTYQYIMNKMNTLCGEKMESRMSKDMRCTKKGEGSVKLKGDSRGLTLKPVTKGIVRRMVNGTPLPPLSSSQTKPDNPFKIKGERYTQLTMKECLSRIYVMKTQEVKCLKDMKPSVDDDIIPSVEATKDEDTVLEESQSGASLPGN